MRTCKLANVWCEVQTNKKCFSCGEPICGRCSIKVEYLKYGVKRLCLDPCFRYLAEDLAKHGTVWRRGR